MNSIKPQLAPLHAGDEFKVLEVTGEAGADMPLHYCTSEAVINVQEGRAILTIDDKEKELLRGTTILLPANKVHSLKVTEALKAFVVMAKEADIKFAN
jgi:quercetin dioxygenase-like cupin family protein